MNNIAKSVLLLISLLVCVGLKAQDFKTDSYWDDVDFADTALFDSKAFSDKVVDFLYQYSCCDEQRFDSLSIIGVGIVLEKAKVNMRVYEYIIEFLLNGYSSMGKSQVVDYLLTYPKLLEGEVSMEEGLRLDSITEPYQLVKVGATAPDFAGFTIDGASYSINASKANRIIIVFWSTDCEYCHDFLSAIRKNLDLKYDYELVTFALANDVDEVRHTVKKMRLPGYHFYDDLRWEGKAFLDYHVTSTPTVFVLDENKTIVCKPYDWYELMQWIKSNR